MHTHTQGDESGALLSRSEDRGRAEMRLPGSGGRRCGRWVGVSQAEEELRREREFAGRGVE